MHGQILRNPLFKFVTLALLALMSSAGCVTETPVAERVIAVGERVPEFSRSEEHTSELQSQR